MFATQWEGNYSKETTRSFYDRCLGFETQDSEGFFHDAIPRLIRGLHHMKVSPLWSTTRLVWMSILSFPDHMKEPLIKYPIAGNNFFIMAMNAFMQTQ